jgi:hypothetical protein
MKQNCQLFLVFGRRAGQLLYPDLPVAEDAGQRRPWINMVINLSALPNGINFFKLVTHLLRT